MHTLTNQAAQGLTVLDIAPSREAIAKRIAEVGLAIVMGKFWGLRNYPL
jgi:hypothetical protein